MNTPNEQEIETLLRHSPRPEAPAELKQQLIREARSAQKLPSTQPSAMSRPWESWFPRWRPVLLPAAFSLVCAAVLAVQQVQVANLKQEIQRLSNSAPAANGADPKSPAADKNRLSETTGELDPEIARLKDIVATLTADVSQLERMRTENQELRAKLSTQPDMVFSENEMKALEQMARAKESAQRIACVNNLKQLGLAALMRATDSEGRFPMNVIDMTSYMNTPKLLHCPSDTVHETAGNFSSYTPANLSYEYLAPGAATTNESNRVLFRCPIHNNVCLLDGSVQSVGTNTTELMQRDGNLYFVRHPSQ